MEQTTFRRHDLDWIRVIATIGVFLYHCSMFVNPFPWHVKNNLTGAGSILVFSLLVGAWIMPIFFAISGISVTYTLKKRTFTQYVKERLKYPFGFNQLELHLTEEEFHQMRNDLIDVYKKYNARKTNKDQRTIHMVQIFLPEPGEKWNEGERI